MIIIHIKIVAFLFVLTFFATVAVPSDACSYIQSENLPVTIIDLTSETPTYYAVDTPWFYQEHSGSCGAAALRTAFGQLGYSTNESEIRIAAETTNTTTLTGDMIRASHFSNASNEDEIQGYNGKPFGTDSYEIAFDGGSSTVKGKPLKAVQKMLPWAGLPL